MLLLPAQGPWSECWELSKWPLQFSFPTVTSPHSSPDMKVGFPWLFFHELRNVALHPDLTYQKVIEISSSEPHWRLCSPRGLEFRYLYSEPASHGNWASMKLVTFLFPMAGGFSRKKKAQSSVCFKEMCTLSRDSASIDNPHE